MAESLDSNRLSKAIRSIGDDFKPYADLFLKNNIDGATLSKFSDEDELMGYFEKLGVKNAFHRKIISENVIAVRSSAQGTAGDSQESTASTDFRSDGIRLSDITEFVAQCGGRNKLKGLTTTVVKNKYLKPMTHSKKFSYCELLKNKNSESIAQASVFISHAWEYKFLDVFDALTNHFRNQSNVFLWFDLFSVNQHTSTPTESNWFNTTLKTAIEKIGHTVLVLPQWEPAIPLSRTWCLYELCCTAASKTKFDIAFKTTEQKQFYDSISEDCLTIINNILTQIDMEKSHTTIPTDKITIIQAIENNITTVGVNGLVFELLKSWVVDTVTGMMKLCTDEIEKSCFQNSLGVYYMSHDMFGECEPLFTKALKARQKVLGESHVNTLTSMSMLGLLFDKLGRYDEALPLLLKCFGTRQKEFGENDPGTLAYMNNLGYLYKNMGRYEDALPLYTRCLDTKKKVLGEKHPETLISITNLAALHDTMGNYDDALPLYINCLELRTELYGERHPITLTSMNNLGVLYDNMGRYDDALEIYVKALRLRSEVLGEMHPETLTTMNNLGLLYKSLKRYDDALPLYTRCLRIKEVLLGDKHHSSLTSMNNLGALYRCMGRLTDALPLYTRCLEITTELLGDTHPHTVTYRKNLLSLQKIMTEENK